MKSRAEFVVLARQRGVRLCRSGRLLMEEGEGGGRTRESRHFSKSLLGVMLRVPAFSPPGEVNGVVLVVAEYLSRPPCPAFHFDEVNPRGEELEGHGARSSQRGTRQCQDSGCSRPAAQPGPGWRPRHPRSGSARLAMGRLVAARPRKLPWGGQCRHSRHLMWLCPGTTGAGAGAVGGRQMHSARAAERSFLASRAVARGIGAHSRAQSLEVQEMRHRGRRQAK